MSQKEFLLEWLRQHSGEKYSPESLREAVELAFREATGRSFGDVGKAARDLQKIGRIQRSSKGSGQRYWYDPQLDSQVPTTSSARGVSRGELEWQSILLKGDGLGAADWSLIGECVKSGLSPAALNKFLTSFATLLSKSGLRPPLKRED